MSDDDGSDSDSNEEQQGMCSSRRNRSNDEEKQGKQPISTLSSGKFMMCAKKRKPVEMDSALV